MSKRSIINAVFFVIFIIAAFVRFYPATLNRDANDDHFRVIEIIAYEQRIPDKEELDCLQCYHPKLYHWSAAKLVRLFQADPNGELKVISQLLSVFAGLLTLLIAYLFLRRLPLRDSTRIFSFLLLAVHPALVAINIQATNDSFVILFSSVALYSLFRFLTEPHWSSYLFTISAVVLAGLSKGSGLIIFLGIAFIFLVQIITADRNKHSLVSASAAFGVFIIIVPLLLAAFGPYDEHFIKYGSPLVINKEKSPPPHFFEKTYVGGKTGIVSLYDGYLTFPFFDLLKTPYLDRESLEGQYPASRTSLWTQLYARTTFVQYEGRPRDWFTKLNNPVYDLGRIIFVIALIPLTLFLLGSWLDARTRLQQLFSKQWHQLFTDPTWIFSFFFWGFLLFIIKFTFEYREFSAMKPIYIYPALLALLYIFARGLDTFQEIKNKYLRLGILASLAVLALLFLLDLWFLIQKLS